MAAHRGLAEPGYFVSGNRVLLSKVLTEAILADDLEPEVWPLASWVRNTGEMGSQASTMVVSPAAWNCTMAWLAWSGNLDTSST